VPEVPKNRTDDEGRAWTPHADPEFATSWRDTRWRTTALDGDHMPGMEYELEWRVYSPGDCDTGWHLYGAEGTVFGENMGRTLAVAIPEAARWISGRVYQWDG
jgi:hypothetical protein